VLDAERIEERLLRRDNVAERDRGEIGAVGAPVAGLMLAALVEP